MKVLLVLVAFIYSSLTLLAQDSIVLTTPIAAKAAIASFTPGELRLTIKPNATITVTLIATDDSLWTFTYPCDNQCAFDTNAKVLTLLTTLNTANLSIRSLWRRIFDRLLLDFPSRFVGGATVP